MMKERQQQSHLRWIILVFASIIGVLGILLLCGGFSFSIWMLSEGNFQSACIMGISAALGLYFAWIGFSLVKKINIKRLKHLSAAIAFTLWIIVSNISEGFIEEPVTEDGSDFHGVPTILFIPAMIVVYWLLNMLFFYIAPESNL